MALETVGVRAVVEDFGLYISRSQQVSAATLAMGTAAQKAGTLGAGLTTFLKNATLLGAGLAAALGGLSLKGASEFSTSLAKIDALTNTTTEDVNRLGKGLLNLAKVVPKSPNELGAAAYFALSSGITDVNEALKLVTAAAKASAAGLGSTADIVDIVTAAVNAYGPANLDAAHAVDVLVATVREGKGEPAAMATALGTLLPIAAALQIPFEDLAATFASLTNALGGGGAAELAGTQLRGILSQLASPSKEAKNALAEAEAGVKTLSQEELALAEAHRAVVSASDNMASSQRGVRDAAEGVTQAQRGVRDATQGVADAQRASRSATEALRNAYADLTQAQRNQQQASLDGRRETLSVLEAEQGLAELRTQAGAHGLELAAAELALAQAREQASAGGKKTALEQRQASLAVSQAEQRLNQVRAQGGRFSLDLQNAELRLADSRRRVGTAQRQQDKDVADAQKNIERNTQAVADAHRNELKARENVTDATKNLNRAYEGQEDAQRGVARAGTDLALAQEKELLAQIHTRDAYAALRKEIQEKGLVPTLQRLNELFAGNQEGLAKLFPDVRAFTGFLSAITSQGAATASILERIRGSAGITEEAFGRMSKEVSFQAALLKNTLNVALIELGSVVLPIVNQALQAAVKWLLQASEFFKKGLDGTKIGGDFSTIQQAAFDAGEKVRGLFDFIKQNKDSTLLPTGKLFLEGLKTVAEWFIEHKEAIAAAFFLFAATNPLWAGILIGGAIITGIGLLGASIDGLTDPLLRVRAEIDKTIIRMADFANTFLSLGLNKVPGVKELVPTVVGSKGAEEDLRKVEEELARRKKANDLAAEAARQLKEAQEEALRAGVPYVEFLRSQIEKYIAAGATKMDEFLARLLKQYEALPGSDKGFIEKTKNDLQQAAPAAEDLKTELSQIRPPNVGDAGLGPISAARRAAEELRLALEAAGRAAANIGSNIINKTTNLIRRAEGGIVRRPEFALIGEAGPEAVLPLSDPARSLQILSALPPALVKAIMPKPLAGGGVFGERGLAVYGHETHSWEDYWARIAGGSSGGFLGREGGGGESSGGLAPAVARQVYASLASIPPSLIASMASTRTGGGANFESLFGDVTIGSTSREVEQIAVATVRTLFARARTQTAIGGGLITSGIG